MDREGKFPMPFRSRSGDVKKQNNQENPIWGLVVWLMHSTIDFFRVDDFEYIFRIFSVKGVFGRYLV